MGRGPMPRPRPRKAMTKHLDIIFSIFYGLFLTAGYMAMAVLKGLFRDEAPYWKGGLAVCGLIVYIVAIGTVLVAHRNAARPMWELYLAFAAPYVLYALLFLSFDWKSKELWRFTGAFQFLSIAGGFILGIVLSPLIAVAVGSFTGREALDYTVFGFRFIHGIGLKDFATVLGAGFVAALIYFAGLLVTEIGALGTARKVFFYIILLNATALFAYYAYTMTTFHAGTRPWGAP